MTVKDKIRIRSAATNSAHWYSRPYSRSRLTIESLSEEVPSLSPTTYAYPPHTAKWHLFVTGLEVACNSSRRVHRHADNERRLESRLPLLDIGVFASDTDRTRSAWRLQTRLATCSTFER